MIVLVLGGQYGDEGKGGVAQWFARNYRFDLSIRLGGSNAGHSCFRDGIEYEMRQLPTSWATSDAPIFIPDTALVNKAVFLKEVELVRDLGYKGDIWLSTHATVIDDADGGWRKTTRRIGSMGSGTGVARAKRVLREAKKVYDDDGFRGVKGFGQHEFEIKPMLEDPDKSILVEGTQGFGLSLNFSGQYPFVTSIDLTPYQMLAECGFPWNVHHVITVMVLRTFPVRVPNPPDGTSGMLYRELSWGDVQKLCEHPIEMEYDYRPPIWETKVPKRIGMFENEMVKRAIWHCRPAVTFLTHLDWYFPDLANIGVTDEVDRTILSFEHRIDHRIDFVGAGKGVLVPTKDAQRRYGSELEGLI